MWKKKTPDRVMLKMGGGFAFIAAWQVLVFLLLLLLVWVDQVVDMSALLFGGQAHPVDLTRGCLESAGVLLAAVIVVGNTYLQQRRIVSGLLTICSYCKKIRLDTEKWQQIEEYIGKRSPINFTHSVCPPCLERAKKQVDDAASAQR
ncbi:MAG: hypothetical protein K8T26_07255 [Lentisphaerae bacterium]|nr:hypothetical protein [Lentisphaerota bacterium]